MLGRADQEHGLHHTDGQAGHADGHDLGDPPGGCEQEQAQGRLALASQHEVLTLGINGVG